MRSDFSFREAALQVGGVGARCVELALQVVLVGDELIPFGEESFVLVSKETPFLSEPGAVRIAELSECVADELPLLQQVALDRDESVLGVQRSFSPGCVLLGGACADLVVRLIPGTVLGGIDDGAGVSVFVGERS